MAGTTTSGALSAAKSAFDANDMKAAKAQLEWVLAHGNDEQKNVAAIRLAGVLLDEKAYDAALKALSGATLPQFKSSVEDRKGDILAAQNKMEEARNAYKAALESADKNNPGRQLIQLKLESIGGTVPEVKA
ncbi:MAG: hypothetical protein K0R43_4300 [Pseudoduganella sp.]|nr:hypothetical protein [Pseudoduganella sp.]